MAKLHLNDPLKAKEYFAKKVTFSLGPVEVDYFKKEGKEFNLIDVRAAEDYAEGHVPGAVNLPEEEWNTFKGLSKETMNVVYCYSITCHLAAKAAEKFAGNGYPVMEMDGGFESWKEMELEIETGSRRAA